MVSSGGKIGRVMESRVFFGKSCPFSARDLKDWSVPGDYHFPGQMRSGFFYHLMERVMENWGFSPDP
jgi:hypothetical protein